MTITDNQRVEALKRLCDVSICQPDPDVLRFLDWMIRENRFRFSVDFVFRTFYLDEGSPRRTQKPHESPLTTSEKSRAGNLLTAVRRHIDRFYDIEGKHHPPNVLWVHFPPADSKASEINAGGVSARFDTDRPPAHKTTQKQRREGRNSSKTGASWNASNQLWSRMLQPLAKKKPLKGVLIYSNWQPELHELSKRIASKLAGKYAGSGEVAAAFYLGNAVANIPVQFTTYYSETLSENLAHGFEALSAWNFLVFLGSPLTNRALDKLRLQPHWQGRQGHHFASYRTKTGLFDGPPRYPKTKSSDDGQIPLLSTETTDYALVTFLKNEATKQVLVAMAGIDTGGTLGAAMCLCYPAWTTKLLSDPKLTKLIDGPLPSFEIVLKITLEKSFPTDMEVLTVRYT